MKVCCVPRCLCWVCVSLGRRYRAVLIYACPPPTRDPRGIECNICGQLNFKELLI